VTLRAERQHVWMSNITNGFTNGWTHMAKVGVK